MKGRPFGLVFAWRGLLPGALTLAVISARDAKACGVSGPGGVEACSLEEHAESERPKFRVGVSGLYTWTSISFSDGSQADETRQAILATASYLPTNRVSLQVGLGATLGGHLTLAGTSFDFAAGPTATLGGSFRVLDGDGARPFVVLSALLSFETTTTTGDVGYTALDLRLGGVVGWSIAGVVSPFVSARGFGGPVFWRNPTGASVTGTDTSHYQVGGGVAVLVAKRVDVFAEGIPLGERAVSAGVGVAF